MKAYILIVYEQRIFRGNKCLANSYRLLHSWYDKKSLINYRIKKVEVILTMAFLWKYHCVPGDYFDCLQDFEDLNLQLGDLRMQLHTSTVTLQHTHRIGVIHFTTRNLIFVCTNFFCKFSYFIFVWQKLQFLVIHWSNQTLMLA